MFKLALHVNVSPSVQTVLTFCSKLKKCQPDHESGEPHQPTGTHRSGGGFLKNSSSFASLVPDDPKVARGSFTVKHLQIISF